MASGTATAGPWSWVLHVLAAAAGCCHSSIFVSLCSACLKDCNIYLNIFFCRRRMNRLHVARKAPDPIPTLSVEMVSLVEATHFDFGICGFLCNSWSFHICMCLQIYCLARKKNVYARISGQRSLSENHVIYALSVQLPPK